MIFGDALKSANQIVLQFCDGFLVGFVVVVGISSVGVDNLLKL
jgi:hypothetical protein